MKPFKFCPKCSARLKMKELDHKPRAICPECGFVHYANPVPAAGVILVENGKILMVRRRFEPRAGLWSLPAGFLESDEDIRECAVREMKEETNLDVRIERLFNVYSAFDDPRTITLLVVFTASRIGGELRCGDDASEARFFDLDSLPEEIAFRAHRSALDDLRKESQLTEPSSPQEES